MTKLKKYVTIGSLDFRRCLLVIKLLILYQLKFCRWSWNTKFSWVSDKFLNLKILINIYISKLWLKTKQPTSSILLAKQVHSGRTMFMNRRHGTAVWETDKVVETAAVFQLRVISGFDGMWVRAEREIPADWRPGMTYDLGFQIDAIAKGQESCTQCDEGHWWFMKT